MAGTDAALLGRTVGGCRISAVIGRGGMGTVFQAVQEKLAAPVALKIIKPGLADDPQAIARFEQEAKAIAKIRGKTPHVVQVYDHGWDADAGVAWISMERVDGEGVDSILRRVGKLPDQVAIRIARQAAEALEVARQHELVHRDMKPENLLLTTDGTVKVTDFGLAKVLGSSAKMTASGQMVGTPSYMAPEQALGESVDHRTDIYSLGATLFTLLTGETPFRLEDKGGLVFEMVLQIATSPFPTVRDRGVEISASLEEVLGKMTARSPGDRYQTAGEAAKALADCLQDARPDKVALAGLAQPPKLEEVAPAPAPSTPSSAPTRPTPTQPRAPAPAPKALAPGPTTVLPAKTQVADLLKRLQEQLKTSRQAQGVAAGAGVVLILLILWMAGVFSPKPPPPPPPPTAEELARAAIVRAKAKAAKGDLAGALAELTSAAGSEAAEVRLGYEREVGLKKIEKAIQDADSHARARDWTRAREILTAAEQVHADHPQIGKLKDALRSVREQEAETKRRGEFRAAMDAAEEAQKPAEKERTIAAWQALGAAAREAVDLAKAEEERRAAGEILGSAVRGERWAEAKAAEEAGRLEGPDGAIGKAEEADKALPGNSELGIYLASLKNKRDDRDNRRKEWEKRSAEANAEKDPGRAAKLFQDAVAWCDDPASRDETTKKIESLEIQARQAQDERKLRDALEAASDAEKRGEWKEAFEAYAKALEVKPGDADLEKASVKAERRFKSLRVYLTRDQKVVMEFVYVRPGKFTMGDGKGPQPEEASHTVTLTKGFWIQKTEVTQAQWQALMGTNPSEFKSPDRPVDTVSWNDCQAFLDKLNAILDKPRRAELPTEAEWEYASRAGSEARWSFGDDPKALAEYAWYDGNAQQGTEPAGKKRPNSWGLHDMHGNVWEWCADWYGGYKADAKDPTGPGIGTTKVLRGGGWASPVVQTRCAARNRKEPEGAWRLFGFRVVLR